MAKIKWSHDSIEDLKEICCFIALDSPYYANLLNDRIFEMVELMAVVDLFSGFNKLMDGLRVEPDEKPWYG